MGLFDKKTCALCDKSFGMMGGKKVSDGEICKDCLKDKSEWLGSIKKMTVSEVKEHLEARKAGRQEASAFNATRSFGKHIKLYIDDQQQKFMLTRKKFNEADVFRFSQIQNIDFKVDESAFKRSEPEAAPGGSYRNTALETALGLAVNQDQNGRPYNPREYKYSYTFRFKIEMRDKFIDMIDFNISPTCDAREDRDFVEEAGNALAIRDALYQIKAQGNMASAAQAPMQGQMPGQYQQGMPGQFPQAMPGTYPQQAMPGQYGAQGYPQQQYPGQVPYPAQYQQYPQPQGNQAGYPQMPGQYPGAMPGQFPQNMPGSYAQQVPQEPDPNGKGGSPGM